MRRHTATARRNPSIQKMHKATALQVTKCGQTTVPNTQARSRSAKNCNASHVNGSHSTDTIAGEEVTVTECIEDIFFIARQVIIEGYRVLLGGYQTLAAMAHLLANACKLTWALGCLTMVMGRYFSIRGKAYGGSG